MELIIHFKGLPDGMDLDGLKRGLDEVLEDDGWPTDTPANSMAVPAGK